MSWVDDLHGTGTRISNSWRTLCRRAPFLSPPVLAAVANFKRTIGLAELPFRIFEAGLIAGRDVYSGALDYKGDDDPAFIAIKDSIRNTMNDSGTNDRLHFWAGAIPSKDYPQFLESLIVSAWTAYETLTGDLLRAAIDARNTELAKVESFPSTADIKRRSNYKLQIHGGIVKAYETEFPTDNDEILDAIRDHHVRGISLVRNVIVHKSGIVDGRFLTDATGNDLLQMAELNKPFPLSGDMVFSFIAGTIRAAESLICNLRDWIKSHPVNT